VYRAEGARILFADQDVVRPSDLVGLKNVMLPADFVRSGGNYFMSRPIVILNACETGVDAINPMTVWSFQDAFSNLGAGGIVVTHAPVWESFAFHFGSLLVEKISANQTVATAMLETRRDILGATRNPFGLLYAFYGSPYLSLQTP